MARITLALIALLAVACGGGGSGTSSGGGGPPPSAPTGPAASGDGPWLNITPSAFAPATQSAAYSLSFTVQGGTQSGYSWSATGLPVGLSLSGATVTGSPAVYGDFSVTIRCRDGGAAIGSLAATLTVVPAGSPLAITTSSLADGVLGGVYSQKLFASGGSGSYTWSIDSGVLPTGLALAGNTISGVPLSGGTSFTVRVADGSTSVTASLSIAIPSSAIVFVDGSVASSATYNPVTRSATGGTYTSYSTMGAAAASTYVIVRAGTYTSQLVPATSSTWRAYGSEAPVITGSLDPAIDLTSKSNVMIDGLTVQDVVGWVRGVDAHYNEIRNCRFYRATATGTRGAIALGKSTYNRIVGNWIEDGNDDVGLYLSDHNLVEGNVIRQGRHTLWRIVGGSYNVVRNNYFRNTTQKIGECFDFEGGVSWLPEPVAYDVTKYNVIESNVFDTTGNSGNASPFAGIQYAAQHGIIRHNVFYDCVGPGLDFTLYDSEARYNTDNRAYGNVFTRIGNGGVTMAGGTTFSGQQLKNNVLYRNIYNQTDMRWAWYVELDGKPVQVKMGRVDGFVFDTNVIFGTSAGELYTVAYGDRTSTSNPAPQNLAWWETNHPSLFKNSIEQDPLFTDPAANDYTLQSTSPAVDAGAWLTTASSAGSGTSLAVADATWFTAGNGVAAGDEIQLEGQTVVARVVAVNATTNVLTLSTSLSWSAGAGVARKFSGARPDVGAFER